MSATIGTENPAGTQRLRLAASISSNHPCLARSGATEDAHDRVPVAVIEVAR